MLRLDEIWELVGVGAITESVRHQSPGVSHPCQRTKITTAAEA